MLYSANIRHNQCSGSTVSKYNAQLQVDRNYISIRVVLFFEQLRCFDFAVFCNIPCESLQTNQVIGQ